MFALAVQHDFLSNFFVLILAPDLRLEKYPIRHGFPTLFWRSLAHLLLFLENISPFSRVADLDHFEEELDSDPH